MRRSDNIIMYLLIPAFLFLVGCKKEDPNPELKDPIYADLQRLAKEYDEKSKTLSESLSGLRKELQKTEPNTLEMKDVKRNIAKTQADLLDAEQMKVYYRIRSERRRLVGRLAYKEAFKAGKEWPEAKEYEDYQLSLRLRQANLNWASRVPRLQDRLNQKEAPKAAPAEAKAEGGEE